MMAEEDGERQCSQSVEELLPIFVTCVSESDDADKDLLLDWRGRGSVLKQQSLGFKKVKPRDGDVAKMAKQQQNLNVREKPVLVLSDDDDDGDGAAVRRVGMWDAWKKAVVRPPASDVVFLDSDSEPESGLHDSRNEKRTVGLKNCRGPAVSERNVLPLDYVNSSLAPNLPKVTESLRADAVVGKASELQSSNVEILQMENPGKRRCTGKTNFLGEVKTNGSRPSKDVTKPTGMIHIRSWVGNASGTGGLEWLDEIMESTKPETLRESVACKSPGRISSPSNVLVSHPASGRGHVSEQLSPNLSPKWDGIVGKRSAVCDSTQSDDLKFNRVSEIAANAVGLVQSLVGASPKSPLPIDCVKLDTSPEATKKFPRVSPIPDCVEISDSPVYLRKCFQSQVRLSQENASRPQEKTYENLDSDSDGDPDWRDLSHGLAGSGPSTRDSDGARKRSPTTSRTSNLLTSQVRNFMDLRFEDCTYEVDVSPAVAAKRKSIELTNDPIIAAKVTNYTAEEETGVLRPEEGPDDGPTKPKTSNKRRKGPDTGVDFAAREEERARKQRELQLKKAQKEDEKRRRQEAKEELKKKKEAAKGEAAVRRKKEQEANKWSKGKFAMQNTTAYIDAKIMNEIGALSHHLLRLLTEKDYKYQIVSNPVERTILWTMKAPKPDSPGTEALGSQSDSLPNSQVVLDEREILYVAVIWNAVEFSQMVTEDSLNAHIARVQNQHPGYTCCYLVNNLMQYLNKKDQRQYRTGDQSWKRPDVEQVFAEFITHHDRVHYRLCMDETEMADHLVGLMRSLAECPFKAKLSSLALNANGDHIGKGDPNKDIIKKSNWLKALVAIPHISGATAVAISKVYPNMRALLNAYLDPRKTELEKDFLLQDIVKDPVVGAACSNGRRVGPNCSKRIYRVLMARNGNLRTEDAEDGEDLFSS